ncbi:MAG: insulinase family protein [Sphingomonas sp.]
MRLLIGASVMGLLLATGALGEDRMGQTPVAAHSGPRRPAARDGARPQDQTPPSQPWAHDKSDVPADPSIRYGTLPNGVRYAIKRNTTPPGQASVWLRIDAGSLMEKPNQRGLAHFMEHMAFNGTADIPKNELIHKLERLGLQFGADLNAGTTFDQTFYRLDMPRVDDEKLSTALHVLRQQVSAATMDPKDIDGERGVIAGEERLRNSPAVKVGLKQLSALGAGTLLPDRIPIGDMEIIRTAPRERFADYYATYYRPSRATVIAVGDFDVDAMEAKIKLAFADWRPAQPDGPEPDLGKITKHGQEARVYVEPSLSPVLSISWVSPPKLREDNLATRRADWVREIALAVLKRRFAEQSLSDNPAFVNADASDSDLFRSFHVASITATYFPGKWREALGGVEQAVRQFSQYGVSQAEITRELNTFRTRLETAVKNQSTRNTAQLAAIIENDINNREVTATAETNLQIFESVVAKLTPAQVSEAARQIFVGEGPLVTLNATAPVEGGDEALAAAFDASKQVAVAAVQPPAAKPWQYTDFGTPGQVVARSAPDKLGATTVTFANGVKLTVKTTDYNKGEIQVGLLTGIGERNFGPDKIDPRSAALGYMTAGGLGKMTYDEVGRSLNGHIVGAGLSMLGQRFMLSGNTRPSDLDMQLQYMAAYLTDPAFRSAPFDKALATAPAGWIVANSSPAGVYGLKVRPAMAGGDQRLAIAPPELSNTWKMDPLRGDLKAMLAQGPIHIVMVGEVSVDDAIRAVAPTFGALPPRPDYNSPAAGADQRHFAAPTPTPRIFTHNGLKEQSLGLVAFPTVDVTGSRKLARQLSVLKSVVQLRVLDVIREEEALAYSPGVKDDYSPDYKGFGTLEISAATAPEKLPAFYAAVDRIVRGLQTKPVSVDELRRARQPMIEHIRQNMNTNGFWFAALLGEAYRPSTVEDALTIEADYNSVTPAMIQALARQYLRMDKAFKASVLPSNTAEGN